MERKTFTYFTKRAISRASQPLILSGEDPTNIGPVALMQDLAVMATLGIEHVERNGHHYFAGLSAFPGDIQQAVISAHPNLYEIAAGPHACASARDDSTLNR
jgi:hypothetical protein